MYIECIYTYVRCIYTYICVHVRVYILCVCACFRNNAFVFYYYVKRAPLSIVKNDLELPDQSISFTQNSIA